MKKIIMVVAAMALSIASFAQDAKSIYNKYSDKANVSAVYVSPSMFKLIGNLPDIDMPEGEVNITPFVRQMDGMYLIDSENSEINASILADAEKLVKSSKYELLIEAKDGGEAVRIYTISDADTVSNFVMIASELEECTFISINGKIAKKDLEKLLSAAVNN